MLTDADGCNRYAGDTRRLRVEIEAKQGELFIDAPFVDVDAAGLTYARLSSDVC